MVSRSLLLDTNVLLAMLLAPDRLPKSSQETLQDPQNRVWFSVASLWEISIKSSLGRADFDFQTADIHRLALDSGLIELPIEGSHTYTVATLPWIHRDPFDRLLVAQALRLPAQLLTTDRILAPYSPLVEVLPWES